MKPFLIFTAFIEAAAGLALLALPSVVVKLLLGAEISGAAIPLGRLAGAALLALGVVCWLARDDTGSRAGKGVAGAMLVYNVGAVVILGAAGIQLPTVGVALWPAVVLHAAMGVWCIRALVAPKGF